MKLILGTAQFGFKYGINNKTGVPKTEEITSILDLAASSGIEKLDTAEGYGKSQEALGQYFKSRPAHSFHILTKFSQSQSSITESLKNTLQVLGIKKIKGYSFHQFIDLKDQVKVAEMRDQKEHGLVEYIGVSIYTPEEMIEASKIDFIDYIQTPFNLFDHYGVRGKSIDIAKQNGKHLYARSVFLQGLFFHDLSTLPVQLKPLVPAIATLIEIAKTEGKTLIELALQYVNSCSKIDGILVGVESKKQLEENIKAIQGNLSPSSIQKIETLAVDAKLIDPRNWKH